MAAPFTNIHIHIFNAECAPENFLKVIPIWLVRTFPKSLKKLIETKISRHVIRLIIWFTSGRSGEQRKALDKYISFLNIATQTSQGAIFEKALRVARLYDGSPRLVALSLNMSYMDDLGAEPIKNFTTQLHEIKYLKKYYPDYIFPFLSVDPRHLSGKTLKEWASQWFDRGVVSQTSNKAYPYFSGIKMYPALGFFPFDPALDELYAYAEANNIPIMSHCTRSGSIYVGSNIEGLIPHQPPMIMPNESEPNNAAETARNEIYQRIERYYTHKQIKNNKKGNNNSACELFGHPQNYVPIMEKYPKLKICLAHMGGGDEVASMSTTVLPFDPFKKMNKENMRSLDNHNWAKLIQEMQNNYLNLYTDISYTLYGLKEEKILKEVTNWLTLEDKDGQLLGERVLFGTDFFMTEQEAKETELYTWAAKNLSTEWFNALSRTNTERFLHAFN